MGQYRPNRGRRGHGQGFEGISLVRRVLEVPENEGFKDLVKDLGVVARRAKKFGELTVRGTEAAKKQAALQIVHSWDFRGSWNDDGADPQELYFNMLNARPTLAKPLVVQFVDIQHDTPQPRHGSRRVDSFLIGMIDDESADQTEDEWTGIYDTFEAVSSNVPPFEEAFDKRWQIDPNMTFAYIGEGVPGKIIDEATDVGRNYLHVDVKLSGAIGNPPISDLVKELHRLHLLSLESGSQDSDQNPIS